MALLFVLVACSKLTRFEVTSQRTEGVPAQLLGEWTGTWVADDETRDGELTVRVEQFAGEPIVAVVIDNPCVVPQRYDLMVNGPVIELWAGELRVLWATVTAEGVMDGGYACAADSGSWRATWSRELPPILDLSGSWDGTFGAAGTGMHDMKLELSQYVAGGALWLEGAATFPTLLPAPLQLIGQVRFREGGFDVVLDTTSGVIPALQMAGAGETDPVSVEGLALSSGGVLPSSGVWEAVPVPE